MELKFVTALFENNVRFRKETLLKNEMKLFYK